MKKERQTEQQKMLSGQDAGERLFCMCLVGVFILMWLNLVFLNLRGFFLLDIMSFLKLLMIIYIIVWPMYRNYKMCIRDSTYMYDYGCTEIQYKNQETGKYETL